MRRVRWLEATWPYSVRTLASHLKAYTFGSDSDDGFIIERVRDTHVEGRYFEKVTFDETVRDPFGNESRFTRLSYREVEFVFSSQYPQVELRKYPRGVQSFVARVSEATEFSSSLVSIRADVFKWAGSVRAAFPAAFRIDLADLSDVLLEEDVKAKVVISGKRDILATLRHFTRGYRHTVNRLQMTLDHEGAAVSFQLSVDGTLRSADPLPDDILHAVRRGLVGARVDG